MWTDMPSKWRGGVFVHLNFLLIPNIWICLKMKIKLSESFPDGWCHSTFTAWRSEFSSHFSSIATSTYCWDITCRKGRWFSALSNNTQRNWVPVRCFIGLRCGWRWKCCRATIIRCSTFRKHGVKKMLNQAAFVWHYPFLSYTLLEYYGGVDYIPIREKKVSTISSQQKHKETLTSFYNTLKTLVILFTPSSVVARIKGLIEMFQILLGMQISEE